MANEIVSFAGTGQTLYAVLLDGVGRAWNGTTFVTIAGASWTDYDIAMTEATAGIYLGNMPAVNAGTYQYVVYGQAGGNPAITDAQKDTGLLAWTGSAVAAPAGAAYASVAQLREYLPQVPAGVTYDALLSSVLERATALIDGELGFAFAAFGALATDKDWLLPRSNQTLYLPAYSAGTLTHIYELTAKGDPGETTTEVLSTYYDILDDGGLYRYTGWRAGWYRATAIWGAGPAPTDIVQVCLEKAINLWGARDSRQISDVIGVEGGGAVGYQRSWTNMQRSVLQNVRIRFAHYGFA